jgi:hypothetical protein
VVELGCDSILGALVCSRAQVFGIASPRDASYLPQKFSSIHATVWESHGGIGVVDFVFPCSARVLRIYERSVGLRVHRELIVFLSSWRSIARGSCF